MAFLVKIGGFYVMWLLSLLWGCGSDHFLSYGRSEKHIEYVYVQDNYIDGLSDTGSNEPVWVDSFTQPKVSNGVDIFWVIDGSGSMADDEHMILQGISDMMQNLPMVNWRLIIISMTPHEHVGSSSFPLLPGNDHNDAIVMMSQNVQGMHERGFESLYEFIENNEFAQQWMREDAALLAVFVSDENEGSVSAFPAVPMFEDWLRDQREHVYVSSIINVNKEDSECFPNINDIGVRYMELTQAFNGQIIDICSSDWSQGVADASTQIQLREFLELSRVPINQDEIYVFVNGQPWHDWTYDPNENKVFFTVVPPEETLVEIAYYY